jgi:hypothetical protein
MIFKLIIFVLLFVNLASSKRKDCQIDYDGKVSITTSGRECQRWDLNYPHEPKYQPKNSRHNHCRNPDKDPKGPWCYTTDPKKRFEYCDVTDCNDGTELTCWQYNDIEYRGTAHHTISGIECQSWDRNKPHRPNHRPRKVKSQKNYCRNPDNDPKGPWCYTMDPEVRYEYCDIPKCEDSENANDFDNYENYSEYDEDSWIVPDNNDYSYIDWGSLLDDIFGGAGFDQMGDDEDYEAYDYNTTNFDEYREEYHEKLDCQTLTLSEPGSDYGGLVSVTSSGRKCQNWHDQTPHKHNLGEGYGNHNYCRNYDFGSADAPLGVWCYTTDPNVRWEFCDVPACDDKANDENDDEVLSTCGIPAVDVEWGRGARRVGLPSRLTSRGRIVQSQSQRHKLPGRNKRSENTGNRTPITWMQMLKEKENDRKFTINIYV